jgi:Ni/Co efflux regulator RcnB
MKTKLIAMVLLAAGSMFAGTRTYDCRDLSRSGQDYNRISERDRHFDRDRDDDRDRERSRDNRRPDNRENNHENNDGNRFRSR